MDHRESKKLIMSQLSTKHLLGIKEITEADIRLILETAANFKEVINRPIKKVPSLRDITIANVFFENSTRTRLSFELAQKRLSADVVNFSSSNSSVKKGETLVDTVNNILAMKVDMVVMRHASPGAPHFLSRNVKANIVNAGDGTHEHPSQALLDAFTIRKHLGLGKSDLEGLSVAIVGDVLHSRVARSNVLLLAKLGAKVTLVAPPTLLPVGVESWPASVSYDFDSVIRFVDVVMMLRVQQERMTEMYFPNAREYSRYFGLNSDRMKSMKPGAIVMHPGPMNRGLEISAEVADSSRSVITEQVTNGVSVRMAILYVLLTGGSLEAGGN